MELPIETNEIDGTKVEITKFDAVTAITLKIRLLKLGILKIAKALAGKYEMGMDPSDVPVDALVDAIEEILASAETDKVIALMKDLLKGIRIYNPETSRYEEAYQDGFFRKYFQGEKMLLLYKLLWFSIRTNFSSFFGKTLSGDAK